MSDEVIEAIDFLITLVREEYCDNNFQWTEDGLSMPDSIAQAYESCNILDDFLVQHDTDEASPI